MKAAWHLEAKQLRAQGLAPEEIAHRLGKSNSAVRWVLDENGEKNRARERANLSRAGQVGVIERYKPDRPPITLPQLRFMAASDGDREGQNA